MFDNRTINLGAKIGSALTRVDQQRLNDLLAEMSGTLSAMNGARLSLIKSGSALAMGKTDEDKNSAIIESALDQFIARGREGINHWQNLLTDIMEPSGLAFLFALNGKEISEQLTFSDLPTHDLCILQDSGLSDDEAIEWLTQGVGRAPEAFTEAKNCQDLSSYMAGLISQVARGLNKLEKMGPEEVALLLVDTPQPKKKRSAFSVFTSYVKVLAGAVIVGADVASSGLTVGATIVSVAGGVGLAADGAGEIADDLD